MERALRTYREAVAIVTGGASGIGWALGAELARRGAHVILADRQEDLARQRAEEIESAGGSAEGTALDVRDSSAVEALVADTFARHGRLDYLFNNAGIGIGGEVQDYSLEDWRYIVDVNLMGVVHGIHAAYPRMRQQGFGHLVNTASMAGLAPAPFTTSYSATKHAVVGLSRSLRIEARADGVRVSVLCPGVIRTPILVNAGAFGRTKIAVPPELERQMWEQMRPMDPDRFARRVLDQVARNRSIIVAPRWWKLLWWMGRMSPTYMDWFAARRYRTWITRFRAAARGESELPPSP